MSALPAWWSARELAGAIRSGEVSAREALQDHWERIDALNPVLNAIIWEDRERAWTDAVAADEHQSHGEELGALHGVPLTNKDTNDTAGMPSTWGAPLLRDNVAADDSIIVARLRAAGAVMTGKSNVPEFAAGAHTFNDLHGTTCNPWNPALSAGGSSGGAAAAIAAGIQPFGDGSDMGGSLRIPASFCNLLGLRPSRGRIPHLGSDSWSWLGRTGPLARTAEDIAFMMQLVSGPDPRVPTSLAADGSEFAAPLRTELAGIRIGWSPDLALGIPFEPQVLHVVQRTLAVFEALGAEVVNAQPDLREADFVFTQTRANDFEMAWGDLVRTAPDRVKPEVVENVALGTRQTAADLRALARARTRLEGAVRACFSDVDVLLTPTAQTLPFPIGLRFPTEVDGVPTPGYLDWMRSVCVVSAMDVPALSAPAGFSEEGLPVGMQLIAAPGADRLLLDVANAFESATDFVRRHPTLATRSAL